MIKGKHVLGIVPARGGSKGLPGKNTKLLYGKPLIGWTIETALRSSYLDEVMVTTDSPEIAEVAKKCGASIPFLRPPELAQDSSATIDAIVHAIDFYKQHGRNFDFICLLEPTSPLREQEDIDRPLEILMTGSADAIVGISKTIGTNPAFLVTLDTDGRLQYLDKNSRTLRRQDIPDVYFFEGTIYFSKTDILLNKKTFYHANTIGYEVPKWKSLEIDDIWDFVMVEAIMKHRAEAT